MHNQTYIAKQTRQFIAKNSQSLIQAEKVNSNIILPKARNIPMSWNLFTAHFLKLVSTLPDVNDESVRSYPIGPQLPIDGVPHVGDHLLEYVIAKTYGSRLDIFLIRNRQPSLVSGHENHVHFPLFVQEVKVDFERLVISPCSYAVVRMVGNPTSRRITTSVPYAKAKGDSPVDLLRVVLYAHKMVGSSSTHFPFACSKCFFISSIGILLLASACPFAWG